MAYKTLKLNEIIHKYKQFLDTHCVDESILDLNYKELRKACLEAYKCIESKAISNNNKSNKHFIDMYFGFFLFDYLNQQNDFTLKYESNYDFWRYFAVCVIPDIIAKRWNVTKSDHFYSKPTGIYPSVLVYKIVMARNKRQNN